MDNIELLDAESFNFVPNSVGLSLFFAVVCIIDVFGVFPIVTLPRTVIQCGVYGILVVLLVCSLQIYTAVILGKCWRLAQKLDGRIIEKNRYPYSAVAEIAFGRFLGGFVTILLDVTVFGSGIPNLLVASQNLQLLGLKITDSNVNISFCYWLIVLAVGLCPFLWFGSPKDMKVLCSISVISVTAVAFLSWYCIVSDPTVSTPSATPEDITWRRIIESIGIIIFQFDLHPVLLTIQVDMENGSKISRAVFFGYAIPLMVSLITTALAFWHYGYDVAPNILENLPANTVLYLVVILVTLQLCLTSAIGNSALYQHVEECLRIPKAFSIRRCVVRSVLTLMALFIAESVPRFDVVMGLIGGALTGPLVFVLPPLLYMRLLRLEKRHDENARIRDLYDSIMREDAASASVMPLSIIKHTHYGTLVGYEMDSKTTAASGCGIIIHFLAGVATVCIGVMATIFITYLNVEETTAIANFLPPCLLNITNLF